VKLLLVDPDSQRGPAFAQALAAGGAEVNVAPSASFALTMLEWNKHDAIVSRARLGDMDGAELCGILRSDPSTKDIRFVLVAAAGEVSPAETAETGIDLVLPEALSAPALFARVVQLLRLQAEPTGPAASALAPRAPALAAAPPVAVMPPPTPVAPAPPAPPALPPLPPPALPLPPAPTEAGLAMPLSAPSVSVPVMVPPVMTPAPAVPLPPVPSPVTAPPPAAVPPVDEPRAPTRAAAAAPTNGAAPTIKGLENVGTNGGARTFQGTLDVLEIEELTQAIAVGGKTGRLMLVLTEGGGQILFDSGRVTHAEFADRTGEPAFAALVAAAHREQGGKFCFIPAHPSDLRSQPKTIERGVDQLLLGVVTAMDEEKRA
jgi:CheY-like chemotaxis protein